MCLLPIKKNNMNRNVYLILAFLLSTLVFGQKTITLSNLYDGTFRPNAPQQIHSQQDGSHYTVLEHSLLRLGSAIVQYSYETLEQTATLFNSANWAEISQIYSYEFSENEQKILLETNTVPIFRYSKKARYFIYDIATKELLSLSPNLVQEPMFSPDATKVAYVLDRDIYVLDLNTNQTKRITFDGNDHISNGLTDWVYEEEFKFVRAYDWNKTGTHIGFIRFDESDVPHFSMDVYGDSLYPTQHAFRYPKAGEKNAEVSIHLADVQSAEVRPLPIEVPEYVARLQFTALSNILSVQTLNRHQNNLRLHHINIDNDTVTQVLEETDDAYVDVHDNLTYLSNNHFIWTSERDGYNHLYYYSASGKLIKQLTKGPWEVTDFYGLDTKTKTVYFQSVERGSIYRDVFSVGLNGTAKRRLSTSLGTNSAEFSADFTYYINQFAKDGTPPIYTLHKTKRGTLLKTIEDNAILKMVLENYDLQQKEFSEIEIHGNNLNMWLLKPADFDPNKQYPLLLFQYSGPGSQQVSDDYFGSHNIWHQLLVQKGYIIACVDGRGTGYKGAAFKKSTYLNLVKYETEDQIEVARQLGNRAYIDKNRIGIWGWSFGGHVSTNCILKGNDVFSTAIAVAPVTSWRFYDTIYTERFLRTPQENPIGYDNNSPFNYPELLKGNYLIIHGSGDDNVHVQNTMRMVNGLIQSNKKFEWSIYPDRNHGIYGGNTRLHLFTKMTDFITENL